MPIKPGPNHTMRYYNSSDGRYSRSPFSQIYINGFTVTSNDKEQDRRNALKDKALNSKDKNLFIVYQIIEYIHPGSVEYINEKVFDNSIKKPREIDIMTSKCIYEVKSGKARHKVKQYKAQQQLARSLGKDYVVCSPDSTRYQITQIKRLGIKIFNNLTDFAEMEKTR